VDAAVDAAIERHRLHRYPHARLFSLTAFTQRGARHFEIEAVHG
jgi:hypothetical protein